MPTADSRSVVHVAAERRPGVRIRRRLATLGASLHGPQSLAFDEPARMTGPLLAWRCDRAVFRSAGHSFVAIGIDRAYVDPAIPVL